MTRRHLQIALGLLWLLDGALQLQPFMLGTGFARQVIDPVAAGQPGFVAVLVHWAANLIAAHPVAWDVPFAAIQLLIGLGLLFPRTVKLALAGSILWSIGVWFFGEGLSGLASGHASLLTGAPGSVSLYAVLALSAWPLGDRSEEAPARWLPFAWAVVWIGGAMFQALPGQNTGKAVAASVNSGAPGWLGRLDAAVVGWTTRHGPMVVGALVVAEALIGLGALYRWSRGPAVATGFVLALAIWVVAQDVGQLYGGQATDPNTALVIALMAIAVLGVRRSRSASAASQPRPLPAPGARSRSAAATRPGYAARR